MQLPHFYNEILDHQNTPDDLRRSVESKLLRYKQQYLHALPVSAAAKVETARDLEGMVNGAVILGIPDELAWTIFIEGKDCATIGS
jgi:superkiller protein 3